MRALLLVASLCHVSICACCAMATIRADAPQQIVHHTGEREELTSRAPDNIHTTPHHNRRKAHVEMGKCWTFAPVNFKALKALREVFKAEENKAMRVRDWVFDWPCQ